MESNKQWSPAKASTWLRKYADDVADDAYKDGGDDLLYACAGVAYYAVLHEIGYNTREEFSEFVIKHMGFNQDFLKDALEEIDQK